MPEDKQIAMTPHAIVRHLNKLPREFTRADIIKYIQDNNIKRVNFRYVGGDGRLKTLNFVITSEAYLERILSAGERVDGSSLFPYLHAAGSDLYVIPRYKTAFLNPFEQEPTLDLLCSYYSPDGTPFASSPENILRAAHRHLQKTTGCSLYAMGEIEYYTISAKPDLYPIKPQKGYKESQPFVKMERLRTDAMQALAQAGCAVKYGHSEVGSVQEEDRYLEQNEIELIPVPIEEAADHVALARWVLRMVGQKHGVTVSFSPKIALGHAGSGLHIHMMLVRDGKNVMFEGKKLTDDAKRAVAGILTMTPSLTAFGNVVPTSYLRLVPNHEAPTGVFWGERNRMALVRVPLGWQGSLNMASDANPGEDSPKLDASQNATIEFRCPDGSADIYHLLAGIAVAINKGFAMENAVSFADQLYVKPGTAPRHELEISKELPHIPTSCWESAEYLLKDRKDYENNGVFPPEVIDGISNRLKSYEDREFKLYSKTSAELRRFMDEHLHCA